MISAYLHVGLCALSVFWGLFLKASLSQSGNSLKAEPDISNLFACGMFLRENPLETSFDEIRRCFTGVKNVTQPL